MRCPRVDLTQLRALLQQPRKWTAMELSEALGCETQTVYGCLARLTGDLRKERISGGKGSGSGRWSLKYWLAS